MISYSQLTFEIDAGWNDGIINDALFDMPFCLSIDSIGNIYIADFANNVVRQISQNLQSSSVTTIAGNGDINSYDGIGSAASFQGPTAVYVNPTASIMYVADYSNNLIRQISCTSGMLSTNILSLF